VTTPTYPHQGRGQDCDDHQRAYFIETHLIVNKVRFDMMRRGEMIKKQKTLRASSASN
jgi:septum formation inhibitor-activating ATPase MinD